MTNNNHHDKIMINSRVFHCICDGTVFAVIHSVKLKYNNNNPNLNNVYFETGALLKGQHIFKGFFFHPSAFIPVVPQKKNIEMN